MILNHCPMGSALGKLLQLRCVWTLWRSGSCGCTWYRVEDDPSNTLGRYISISQGMCDAASLIFQIVYITLINWCVLGIVSLSIWNLKFLLSSFHPSAYKGILWIRRGFVWQSYYLHIETGYCHLYASRRFPWIWTQGVGHEYFITGENYETIRPIYQKYCKALSC